VNYKEIEILLASKSPRRMQIFVQAMFNTKAINVDVEENYHQSLSPKKIPIFLANKKANAYQKQITKNQILVAADTIVLHKNNVLNKPGNETEATAMLATLSNNWHTVVTGVSVRLSATEFSFSDTTQVFINKLSKEEIAYYVKNFSPYDKAGSYGVQDWLGLTKVGKIKGCYYNIMGFPMPKFYKKIKKLIP